MSSFTNFLNLFKWDPINDSEEEFDIDKALNDNWDKIDTKFNDLNIKQATNSNNIDSHIENTDNPHNVTKEQLGLGNALLNNSDVKDNTVSFNESTDRTNIESGSSLAVILGRIKKYFSDLKNVAFTGSYNDLIDKPDVSESIIKRDIIEISETIEVNTDYTISLYYQVGNNSLELFYCGEKLIKGQNYIEVGETGAVSNTIQFMDSLGDLDMSNVVGFEDFVETLEFVVRGDYSDNA